MTRCGATSVPAEQGPGAGSPSPAPPAGERRGVGPALGRALVAFALFWWDFLVGETPDLLVGAAVAVGAAALLVHHGATRAVVVGAIPVLVVVALALSTVRARRRSRRSDRAG